MSFGGRRVKARADQQVAAHDCWARPRLPRSMAPRRAHRAGAAGSGLPEGAACGRRGRGGRGGRSSLHSCLHSLLHLAAALQACGPATPWPRACSAGARARAPAHARAAAQEPQSLAGTWRCPSLAPRRRRGWPAPPTAARCRPCSSLAGGWPGGPACRLLLPARRLLRPALVWVPLGRQRGCGRLAPSQPAEPAGARRAAAPARRPPHLALPQTARPAGGARAPATPCAAAAAPRSRGCGRAAWRRGEGRASSM